MVMVSALPPPPPTLITTKETIMCIGEVERIKRRITEEGGG